MFIITDPDKNNPYRHHVNDIETASDIILGITNDDSDYDQALYIMGGMKSGDVFLNKKFAIGCYDEPLTKGE